MTILWINLVFVFIFSLFARYFSTPGHISISLPFNRPNIIFSLLALMSLIFVAGLRSNIGDTYFYKHAYEVNDFSWNQISKQENVGFWLLQKILKNYSEDPQILIFTAAVITNALILFIFLKYSRMFELSIYVYITGGLYLVSMNGLRQVMTAAVIFTATKFLIEGNWFKYILVVLFAATLHESALVLIPIYFFVRYKAWSKATFILLFFAILIVLGFDQFSSILFSTIEDTQYGHYQNFQEGGANVIRVVVYAAPLIIAYFGREKLRLIFPESDYIVNMALIGLVFMIISTQNWIFARFSIYFNLYQLILVSWIVKLFREKDQRFVYYGLLVSYFLFYYYESVISLNIIYKSNYLSL
ncbi:capsular biosynthesis protein [Bacillus sp. AFS073361]|uniref:EpsG family protein n=1 Tax=Bacillus sp. AFS073361 TaxID=2033511 RepID=UPI000BF43CC4|nr:EpsG family protein [Bacillus sp. AFS073361]PFP29492.1 capsular biosynthesis protein [Bacillus sp. AFS073361]